MKQLITKITQINPESIITAFISSQLFELTGQIQSSEIAAERQKLEARKSALEEWINPQNEQTQARSEKLKEVWKSVTQKMLPAFSETKESRHALIQDSSVGSAYQDVYSEARSQEHATPSKAFARVVDVSEQARRFENAAVMAKWTQHYFAEYDNILKTEPKKTSLSDLLGGVSHEKLAAEFVKHPKVTTLLNGYQQGLHTVQQKFDQKSQEIMELRHHKMELLDKMFGQVEGMTQMSKAELAARVLKEVRAQGSI